MTDAGCHRFEGRTVLATGAARGIGQAVAARLVTEGAHVVVADVDGEVAAEAAAAMEGPGRAEAVTLDVTDEAATRALVARIEAERGGLHALFANAAILDISPFGDLTLARFREVVAVNMEGALISAMAAAPALKRATSGGNGRMVKRVRGMRPK